MNPMACEPSVNIDVRMTDAQMITTLQVHKRNVKVFFVTIKYVLSGCDVPGQRYFGRGYIQLTWCYNYGPASTDLFGDGRLVTDPDMVAREETVAWDTAFWFWKVYVHYAPGVQDGRFGASTRVINGVLECAGKKCQ
jgi:hypothetical protein